MDATTLQRLLRLSPRLDELLELDAPARRAYLARLREHDADSADALQALLARQAEVDRKGFLDDTPQALAAATLAGQRLGAYTLVQLLGAGGMGSVWLARRSDGRFEGEVAIKLLNLALLARGGAARFAREAHALARLDHPHIARLLDAGVAAAGQPYLVLERIDGLPIDRWCADRALDNAARLRLMLDVLAAVGHAHQRLVLHRDLKPDNILVDRDGRVKLLDFGIARLIDDPGHAGAATALTEIGGGAFTPDYAAPEQLQGTELTTATDVYALGVLLFELLSGAHPTARAGDSPLQRLQAVREREPQRLSEVVPAAAARALRGDLDNIVARALKKAPSERYASAAALADDIRRHLAHEPVSARADSWAYRASRFVRRHRGAMAALSMTIAALLAGVLGTAWQAVEARRERDEAVFQARRAQAKSNLMNLALNVTAAPDAPLTQREVLERSALLIERQFSNDPRIAVDLWVTLAGQYEHVGDAAMDAAMMQRADEVAQASGDALLIADVACNRVSTELGLGRAERARERLAAGLAALATVRQPAVMTAVACHRAAGELARAEGELPRAIDSVGEALREIEARGDRSGAQYAVLLSFLGQLLADHGELQRARETHQRLAELDAQLGRSDSRGDLRNRRAIASLLLDAGEVREASAQLESILPRVRDIAPEDAPPDWLELPRSAALIRLGRLDEAEAALRALDQRSRGHGAAKVAARADYLLAQALSAQGRFDEAQVLLDAVGERLDPVQRLCTPATLRATILLGQGRAAEADAILALELQRLAAMPPLASHAAALRAATRAKLALGDLPAALVQARAAVAGAERLARDPARSADVGEGLLLLAQAQHAAGDTHGADLSARRARASLAAGLGDTHALVQAAALR